MLQPNAVKGPEPLLFSQQRFGSLHSDVIEQMRFKQRLKVIQSLEDTAKRSVVGDTALPFLLITALYFAQLTWSSN